MKHDNSINEMIDAPKAKPIHPPSFAKNEKKIAWYIIVFEKENQEILTKKINIGFLSNHKLQVIKAFKMNL